MSPLAAKLIVIGSAALLYYIVKLILKGTIKGEAGASMLIFVWITPVVALVSIYLLIYLFKSTYYMFA